jgi:hypothetical protein
MTMRAAPIFIAWRSGVFDLSASLPAHSGDEHIRLLRSKPASKEKRDCNASFPA